MTVKSLSVLALLLVAVATVADGTAVRQGDQDDNTLHVILPRDAIPAIVEPEFEPASKGSLAAHKLVIGGVGEREQRAYSTWQLDRHEIVNDIFEGRPIAVTWGPLCGTDELCLAHVLLQAQVGDLPVVAARRSPAH